MSVRCTSSPPSPAAAASQRARSTNERAGLSSMSSLPRASLTAVS